MTVTKKPTKPPAATSAKRGKMITFTKMQGIGNDAIVLNVLKGSLPASPMHLARKLCNRHTGIGADQLLFLTKSRKYDFGMRIFNADGSEAEMCGNGIRCLARYIKDQKLSAKKGLTIETAAGPRAVTFRGKVIEVDMGEPIMRGRDIPVNLSGRVVNRPLKIDTKDFRITCLSVGNPHCIIFQEKLDEFPIAQFGPLLEQHNIFPRRANISFVNVLSKTEMQVRVWERGSGETRGCGTAACAAAVGGVLNGFTDRKVTVQMPGGKLDIEWDAKSNHILLRGPAEPVFSGEMRI